MPGGMGHYGGNQILVATRSKRIKNYNWRITMRRLLLILALVMFLPTTVSAKDVAATTGAEGGVAWVVIGNKIYWCYAWDGEDKRPVCTKAEMN